MDRLRDAAARPTQTSPLLGDPAEPTVVHLVVRHWVPFPTTATSNIKPSYCQEAGVRTLSAPW